MANSFKDVPPNGGKSIIKLLDDVDDAIIWWSYNTIFNAVCFVTSHKRYISAGQLVIVTFKCVVIGSWRLNFNYSY